MKIKGFLKNLLPNGEFILTAPYGNNSEYGKFSNMRNTCAFDPTCQRKNKIPNSYSRDKVLPFSSKEKRISTKSVVVIN